MTKRFGELLNEGLSSVAKRQGKKLDDIKREVAESLSYSSSTIDSWLYHGKKPKDVAQVAFLVRYCAGHGRVGRDWANGLLVQAHYPHREALLDDLFPERLQRSEIPHVYQNLPPRYGDFLGRETDMARLLEGLESRWPLVSIEGMGGVGKTTLAIETARRCLPGATSAPNQAFQAIAWISAKDRPDQKRWLNDVLDTIAKVLNFPYITQLPSEQKPYEVDMLLRTQRTLIIIDNFETIEDHDLESWMQRVPEPSKVLTTGRYARLRRVWDIHLKGLEENEALKLIRRFAQRLELKNLTGADNDQLLPLVRVTEGSPMAIEMALGHVKYGAMDLQEVVDNLHTASLRVNDVFDYLFKHTWELLTEDACKVLMVMTFFVDTANKEVIGASAGLGGYRLDVALEQLIETSLLDIQERADEEKNRYSAHPLTRAFAESKLQTVSEWVTEARERWKEWYKEFALQAREPSHYLKIIPEASNLLNVMNWLVAQDRIADLCEIFQRIQYFLFAEGYWGSLLQFANQVAKWAEMKKDPNLLADILQSAISAFRRHGDFLNGQGWLERAQVVADDLDDELLQAEIWLAKGRLIQEQLFQDPDAFPKGVKVLQNALEIFQRRSIPEKTVQTLNSLGNFHLRRQLLDDAANFYSQGLRIVEEFSEQIPATRNWHVYLVGNLGMVAGGKGKYKEACEILGEILEELTDQTDTAEVCVALALYQWCQGNEETAWFWRDKAEQIFARLGLSRPMSIEDVKWRQIHQEGYAKH